MDGEAFLDSKRPRPCCLFLRAKSMYYRCDERPGMIHASTTMTYWCAQSGEDVGPDDAVANHARCQEGRGCFTPAPLTAST